ncbi:TetR/AcrR family transcriptional regulator [Nocardiopsis gilva YIM 90087]|uniref:TetR/AcrR family transcriptional regulator n=1 Tax=Nocardiopsis gilva YIM 90087 TaxID=1235441 RepID=A0A223S9E6_9ACTN|nr:TetR/AcrR family transcriptional regulator [Nocardiopsis gilva]ASU84736.1 TetR/AcrR family transcriptional regulator [Nocardiopsis gilva YIM 90087]
MVASADRGRSTRQRLLDAAVVLIGEVGWHNVTTRLVADRAGVNPGVVHYHFDSVTKLLIEACTGVTRGLLDEVTVRLAEQPDVDSGIDWLLNELTRGLESDPAALLLVEAFLASSRLPELRAQLVVQIAEFRTAVADWLRSRGCGDEADAAATVLAAALDGLVLHRILDPELDLAALASPLRRMLAVG